MAENTTFVYQEGHGSIPQAVTGSPCEKKKKREKEKRPVQRAETQKGAAKPSTMTAEGESPLRGAADVGGWGWRGVRRVKGHLPACPDREVLTQEPEEVRRPVLPHAGVSPVLRCLGKSVVPHLNTQRRWEHGGAVT